MMKFLRILIALVIVSGIFGFATTARAESLVAPQTVTTVKVDKTVYKIGEVVTVTVTFGIAPTKTGPIDVIVTVANPAPAILSIDQTSITGKASYKAATGVTPEAVVSDRDTLTTTTTPYIITFKMKVTGLPNTNINRAGRSVSVVANLVDAVKPGTVPNDTGSASFLVMPLVNYLAYTPHINQ